MKTLNSSIKLSVFFISDLSALDNLNCLLILNVSHNLITKLLDFKPPKNLKHANFSHNQIEEIPDLSAYHYLSELYLDSILSFFSYAFCLKHAKQHRLCVYLLKANVYCITNILRLWVSSIFCSITTKVFLFQWLLNLCFKFPENQR